MKAVLYDLKGKKKGEVDLPKIFETKVREDIVKKCYETNKFGQPYSNDPEAGRKHSASGTISHKRHDWKGHYGKGISRLPRKTMWRRGTQFFWIGAEVSGTRGGRRAHGPKGIGKEKKINKNEVMIGRASAFAATANEKYIIERYGRLVKLDAKVPAVIETGLAGMKTKEILSALKNILGNSWELALKKKTVRSGKGKTRGRKYKSNRGIIIFTGSDEKIKMRGVDIKPVRDASLSDLYPLGRIAVYTEKALEELK